MGDLPDSCKNGTCDHNKCPRCKTPHSVPAGYQFCCSCTFGWDSVEGRVSRAYLPGGGGIDEEKRIIAEHKTKRSIINQ